MLTFELGALIEKRSQIDAPYLEFLHVEEVSAGIYYLPTGSLDRQVPHTEDEVYYVVGGNAIIRVADEDRSVHAGSVVYVPKNVEHRFHSIVDALTVLVFFAPAEYTGKKD